MAGLFVDNMTPEQIANARKWIAALRSGKYQQGRGALCITAFRGCKQWCCLGVGSDVVGLEPPDGRGYLSREEVTALGLWNRVGKFNYYNSFAEAFAATLDILNDRLGMSFLQIADVIEQELALVTNSQTGATA